MYQKKERTKPQELKDPWSLRLHSLAEPLAARAFKEGVPPSEIARLAIRKYLEEPRDLDRENMALLAEALDRFRRDFSRTGGNLNQIAKVFNKSRAVKKDDLAEVHEDLTVKFNELSKLLKVAKRTLKID